MLLAQMAMQPAAAVVFVARRSHDVTISVATETVEESADMVHVRHAITMERIAGISSFARALVGRRGDTRRSSSSSRRSAHPSYAIESWQRTTILGASRLVEINPTFRVASSGTGSTMSSGGSCSSCSTSSATTTRGGTTRGGTTRGGTTRGGTINTSDSTTAEYRLDLSVGIY